METNWGEKKKGVLGKLLVQKQEELGRTQDALEKIKQTAIEAPGRMESRYDSTKQEYGYLANDTLGALERLESEIKQINIILDDKPPSTYSDVIKSGSMVKATFGGQEKIYMLLSFGSGEAVDDETLGMVNIISSSSPIGLALLDQKAGEITELNKKQIIIKEIH